MSSRLQRHGLIRSGYALSPTMSPVLGWDSQFLLGILHELCTCTVFLYHHHSLLFILFLSPLYYLPVVLLLVLPYCFTNLGSKWSLAISAMHIPSTLKGKIGHQSDWLWVFPLFQWLTKYFSGGTIFISASVF